MKLGFFLPLTYVGVCPTEYYIQEDVSTAFFDHHLLNTYLIDMWYISFFLWKDFILFYYVHPFLFPKMNWDISYVKHQTSVHKLVNHIEAKVIQIWLKMKIFTRKSDYLAGP